MNKNYLKPKFVKFYDDNAIKFDLGYKGHPGIIEKINHHINIGRESKVLDVGCGTGNDSVIFKQICQSLTIACDISILVLFSYFYLIQNASF